jgi:flagellar hook-associated protein 2
MTLAKTGTSTLTVTRDSGAVEAAITGFVTAYNALQATAGQLTQYDTEKHAGAALVGDSTLRTVQTRIRAALNTPQAGELKVLSKIGVSFQKDGTLAFDAAKLKAVVAVDPGGVAEAVFRHGTPTSTGGIGKQLSTLLDGFTSKDRHDQQRDDGHDRTRSSAGRPVHRDRDPGRGHRRALQGAVHPAGPAGVAHENTGNYLTQQFASMSSSSQ